MRPVDRLAWALVIVVGLAMAGCPTPAVNDATLAYVTLDAQPAASVTLDGELVGNTPLRKYAVTPGSHTVVLECISCPESQSRTMAFLVEAREIYTHDCTRFDAGEAADPAAREPAGAFITVNTKPWSTVYLDGVKIGNTPKRDYPVEPGLHEVTFECGPCSEPQKETHTLVVEAGDTWTHTLVQFEGEGEESTPAGSSLLTVKADPWGTVHLDGELLGKTPIEGAEIPSGEHHLRTLCGPCDPEQDKSVIFNVAPGASHTIDVTFDE